MGMVSFAIADAAREAGAVLACGVPVSAILPGRGRRARGRHLDCGAGTVICNADPKRMLGMLDGHRGRRRLPRAARALEGPQPGRQVQRRARAAAELDRGARARTGPPGRRSTSPGRWRRRSARSRLRGAASPRSPSARSTSRPATTHRPAPEGKHLLSVFGQYAPYEIGRRRLGRAPRRGRQAVHRPDHRASRRASRTAWSTTRCSGRRTSSRGSG